MNNATSDSHELPGPVKDNLDTVADFYARDYSTVSKSRSLIERISTVFSGVIYFFCLLGFIIGWIVLSYWMPDMGIKWFDPSPYPILQGIVGLNGLLITIMVLMRQNRLTQLEEKRAHFNLQVNLLAEQKATKIIKLLEELREDLPNVKTRIDPETEALKADTDHHAILNAIEIQSSMHPR